MGKPESFRALVWLMVVTFGVALAKGLGDDLANAIVALVVRRLSGE